MLTLTSCKDLPAGSRQRAICEGTSGLSIKRTNVFRQLWGLPPFPHEDEVTSNSEPFVATVQKTSITPQQRSCCGGRSRSPVTVSRTTSPRWELSGGPGTQLIEIFKSAGFQSCDDCYRLAVRMDQLGVRGCQEAITEIVRDILPRAIEWEQTSLGWFKSLIPQTVTELAVSLLVKRAIQQSVDLESRFKSTLLWSYGITTVTSRIDHEFQITVDSLSRSGFARPRIFVDVDKPGDYLSRYLAVSQDVTYRHRGARTFGNWFLSLLELYVREPNADRYAVFQDDFVCSLGLQEYLSSCEYPYRGYLNLYTVPQNFDLAAGRIGWYPSNQRGRGAVALVLNRDAIFTLVQNKGFLEKPIDSNRGHKNVDGAIIHAMSKEGWTEYVHNPSLVQHIGERSSMGNSKHPQANSFLGEQFDLRNLHRWKAG